MPNEGMKISQLPAATEVLDSDVLAGVGGGVTRKFTFATIASYIRTKLSSFFDAKQDKITANGVLQGDGNGGVTARNVDATPTASSTALITSGGVKSALDDKQGKITANGVLQGDGAGGVSAITVDAAPTPSSQNLVSSGGVAAAIADMLNAKIYEVPANGSLTLEFASNTQALMFSTSSYSDSQGLFAAVRTTTSTVNLSITTRVSVPGLTLTRVDGTHLQMSITNSVAGIARILMIVTTGTFPTVLT